MPSLTNCNASQRIIVDSIHGDIHPTDIEWKVIDTPSFQRLRHIKQLQMSQVTYPNAAHTRFVHSLGTLAIMVKILGVFKDQGNKLDDNHVRALRLAALLHDIGHYPYSHLMEGIEKVILTEDFLSEDISKKKTIDASKKAYPGHEELGRLIVTNQQDIINVIGIEMAGEVAALFTRTEAADPRSQTKDWDRPPK